MAAVSCHLSNHLLLQWHLEWLGHGHAWVRAVWASKGTRALLGEEWGGGAQGQVPTAGQPILSEEHI